MIKIGFSVYYTMVIKGTPKIVLVSTKAPILLEPQALETGALHTVQAPPKPSHHSFSVYIYQAPKIHRLQVPYMALNLTLSPVSRKDP